MIQTEARRSARVAAGFLVAIDGVDAELVERRGDISATGIYFETDEPVGEVGSVQWLCIASADRAREVRLMAHVVRTLTFDKIGGHRVIGVAFEFMPESEDAADSVERFVQYVLLGSEEPSSPTTIGAPPSSPEPHLSPRLAAEATRAIPPDRPSETAVVRQLSVRSMTLETSWNVAPGEQIRVDIAAPGMARRVRLEGSAVRVSPVLGSPAGPPYEIQVDFQVEIARPPRHGSSMSFPAVRPELEAIAAAAKARAPEEDEEVSRTLDELFSALIHPPAKKDKDTLRPKREHLSGLLSRIRLPTLCALFDMERLSGHLTLRTPTDKAVIFVRDGQLIDVDPTPEGSSARAEVARILSWTEGAFEFDVQAVLRPDKIGVSTTALLLDLAREDDERAANRPRATSGDTI